MLPGIEPVAGKYEILRKLNEGGMGSVYLVRHRLLDELRVIKVMRSQLRGDRDFQSRFLREARTAIQLRHPNIAQLYEFEIDTEGAAYMVLEFIQGRTLENLIQDRTPLSLALKLNIAQQSLRALSFLHKRGFVHRDISPDNIMLTKDSEGAALVKLLDLGIVKVTHGDEALTGTSVFLGKFRYASPEQLESSHVDARSDLYSLGVVLYELLTGVYPIPGSDMRSIMSGHLFRPPTPFVQSDPDGEVPEGIRALILRALEKEPENRFRSAQEFAASLRRFTRLEAEGGDDLDPVVLRGLTEPPSFEAWTERPGTTQEELNEHFDLARRTPSPPFLQGSAAVEGAGVASRERRQAEDWAEQVTEKDARRSSAQRASAASGEVDEIGSRTESTLIEHTPRTDPGLVDATKVLPEDEATGRVERRSAPRELGPFVEPVAPSTEGVGTAFEETSATVGRLGSRDHAAFERGRSRPRSAREVGAGRSRRWIAISAGMVLALAAGFLLLRVARPERQLDAIEAGDVDAGARSEVQSNRRLAPAGMSGSQDAGPLLPSATGRLVVDAQPWAEIVSLRDPGGAEVALPADRSTPLTFELARGKYRLVLAHPEFGQRTVELEVEASKTVESRTVFARDPVSEFLREGAYGKRQ